MIKCQFCSTFFLKRNIKLHMLFSHRTCISNVTYTCPIPVCGRSYSNYKAFKKHKRHCKHINKSISLNTLEQCIGNEEQAISTFDDKIEGQLNSSENSTLH